MTKQTKLSPAMLEVLRLMYTGWELARSGASRSGVRFWVQKGGAGRGGESKNISSATYFDLWQRGLIADHENKYPTSTYKLTPEGKRQVKESEAPK